MRCFTIELDEYLVFVSARSRVSALATMIEANSCSGYLFINEETCVSINLEDDSIHWISGLPVLCQDAWEVLYEKDVCREGVEDSYIGYLSGGEKDPTTIEGFYSETIAYRERLGLGEIIKIVPQKSSELLAHKSVPTNL